MISSKEFSSIIVTIITRVIDNAASQSLSAQPEYHTIMLSFESICEDMNLDQELERHCYQILLRMTADTKSSWWKKVDNIIAYVPEAVQKRYGKLIPTDTTDVHSLYASREKNAHYKRSAALQTSIASSSSTRPPFKTGLLHSKPSTSPGTGTGTGAGAGAVRNKGRNISPSSTSAWASSAASNRSGKGGRFTLHSSPTIMSPEYLNPRYSPFSTFQRNEEDEDEILQLAGVLNSHTPGRNRRVQFNTDQSSGLSVEDLEASTTRVDVPDASSAEMRVLMNEHCHERRTTVGGAAGVVAAATSTAVPVNNDRMTAAELGSPLAANTTVASADRAGGDPNGPFASPASRAARDADGRQIGLLVGGAEDDLSSPARILLSAAGREPPDVLSTPVPATGESADRPESDEPTPVSTLLSMTPAMGDTAGNNASIASGNTFGGQVSSPAVSPVKPIPKPRSVLSELEELLDNVKTAGPIDDFNIKSSVKLLFLFQKFLTSHCAVHHCIHDHPFDQTAVTTPSSTAQMFDSMIASKRAEDVVELDGLVQSPMGLAVKPIGTRALFIWYSYLSSLNDFVSSLFGREQWLRSEMKSYVKAHLYRVIFREWCYYSGVMVHAREHCDITLKRLGISRWVEFLYKKKQLRWHSRRSEEASSFQEQDADIFHHSRSRHFNVSPDRVHKLSYQEKRPPRKPVVPSYSPRRGRSAASPGSASTASRRSASRGSGSGTGATDSLYGPGNGIDDGDKDDDEITSDRFAHLFEPSKVKSSSMLHSTGSQQFQFLNSLQKSNSNASAAGTAMFGTQTNLAGTGTASLCPADREFVRRHWGRAGLVYSKEGWLFQLAAFRRLFKRTVIYHKCDVAVAIRKKGHLRRSFADWKAALARVQLVNEELDAHVVMVGEKLLVHRKRRALRLLREHCERRKVQNAKDEKTMQDLLKNPVARKAARFFQCPAYVKCFNCLKEYLAEKAPSAKAYSRADQSHARALCSQGFRQWRYYLEVTQRLLVEQQLKQLNRLRLFGLKSSILTDINSVSKTETGSVSTAHHHLMEPLSSSSSASLSSKSHNYDGEIDKILHPELSVPNSTLRRQHPLLWQEYNTMYSKIQSSYETPAHAGATGGFRSASSQNKRNIRAIRDYLILLTNRVGYLRALRKLKKYSIFPRLYFSPVDMIKSELNPNKNSLETRRASTSFREKGSCRYFNSYFERVQAQQIAMFRKEKFGRSSSNSGKDVFGVVGYGIPAFEYTSCVVLSNARPPAKKSGSASAISPAPTKRQLASKQAKSFKLQIKSGNNVYSTMVTAQNPYLYHLYENNKNAQHSTSSDDVLQSKQKMNSLFVRDNSSGAIVTASSLYLVQFRRFVQNCRLNVSLRRRSNAVKAHFLLKYHAMYWKLWRNAFLDGKRFRIVLAEKCFRTLRAVLVKRRLVVRLFKKALRAYMLGHWKRFKYTVKGWLAARQSNKQKFVRALCAVTYSKHKGPVVVQHTHINPLTGDPVIEPARERREGHEHVHRTEMVSIKRLFPVTKEKIELSRRLLHYLAVCNTRASVLRRFHHWSVYSERKVFGNRVVEGLRTQRVRNALHKLRRFARRSAGVRFLRHKVYRQCMRQWRTTALVSITHRAFLHNMWRKWRRLYLKNLAGRVWFRPIMERQRFGWDRWVAAVKALNRIHDETVEHLRLSAMHRVLNQWASWRRAVIMSKRQWNRKILNRFSDFAYNSRVHSKLAELRGSFYHLRYKFHIKRSTIDRTLKNARSALHYLVDRHSLSMSHLHGLVPAGQSKTKGRGGQHHGHLNRIKESKALMLKKCKLVRETVLLKNAIARFRKYDKNAVSFAELRYRASQHRAAHMARLGLKNLRQNILRSKLRKEKRKREALSTWKHHYLLGVRMSQFEDVAMDYHDARRLKLTLRGWLERVQTRKEAVKLVKDSKRYRKNRVIGIALLYLRSVATLTRKKEKLHAQQEWLKACVVETTLR